MLYLFYLAGAVALISTYMVITRLNIVHALLYMVMSLLAVALIFFLLGAPFIAALEVIIYAGAIMVLFIFVVMMLNLGPQSVVQERQWFNLNTWRGMVILAGILLLELIFAFRLGYIQPQALTEITPHQVAMALFGPYLLGVELASMLLLAGLVGAYHLGRREDELERRA
ncbi:MAG TPA: NADH-quinone oxidoreductase subunit J [Anaerolineales bacterium]|nr:NADH-quinone oxidoreductase subunit J [Anaerolineales bacterium]